MILNCVFSMKFLKHIFIIIVLVMDELQQQKITLGSTPVTSPKNQNLKLQRVQTLLKWAAEDLNKKSPGLFPLFDCLSKVN